MHDLPTSFDMSIEQADTSDIAIYGGVFGKRHTIPQAGSYVPQHSHTYDHLSILGAGALRVWQNGALLGDFQAPCEIRIPAHAKHTFLTLEDDTTFWCVHNPDLFEVEDEHHLPGTLRDVGRPRMDGMVFALEWLDDFLAENSPLFDQHCLSVGEKASDWLDKNWAMMKRIQAAGGLHLMTARKNGTLLGYLMVFVSPALDEIGTLEGLHTLFYTSPDEYGLGLRLQRASIEHLKDIGVARVVMRAGYRGDGPRLSALYRRLGAFHSGELYTLNLKAS